MPTDRERELVRRMGEAFEPKPHPDEEAAIANAERVLREELGQ